MRLACALLSVGRPAVTETSNSRDVLLRGGGRCGALQTRRQPVRKQRPLVCHRVVPGALAVGGQYTEVPLVFDITTPAWTPLSAGSVEIILTIASAYAAVRILQFITRTYTEVTWTSELAPDSRIKRSKTMTGGVLRAISPPLYVIVPTAAAFHCIRVLTCKMTESMHLCSTCARNTLERRTEAVLDFVLRFLRPVDDLLSGVVKQAVLLAALWFIVTFKNQYVAWVLEQRAKTSPAQLQDFKRVVLPLNSLLSWAIVAMGVITAAGLAGIDVRPVLTFGGVSGLVVGLSAQSVLANMIAGINLFLSRPFVAGDRVQVFSNNGSLIYSGMVERVNPLRTVIRTDRNYPLTLPNKLLSEMVIGNESRFPTMPPLQLEGSRRIQISLKFGLQHFDKLDTTIMAVTKVLEEFNGLNHGIPFSVNIGALSDSEVTLDIQATALKRESSKFGELRLALMRCIKDVLQQLEIDEYKLTF